VLDANLESVVAVKYGEFPPFGPPLPARVQRLFQPDVDLLKKRVSCREMGYTDCDWLLVIGDHSCAPIAENSISQDAAERAWMKLTLEAAE